MNKEFMNVIKHRVIVNPNLLNIGTEYQRPIDKNRIQKISNSIKQFGYWQQEVIIVNEDYFIIDGQHRTMAAKQCNIAQIPICVVQFKDKQLEAKYFWNKNDWNTSLKPIDYWHGRFLAGDIIAKTVYQLESDIDFLLYDKVALKNKSTKWKMTIPTLLTMIGRANANIEHWYRKRDERYKKIFASIKYSTLLNNTNDFLFFYSSCFGELSSNNKTPYHNKIVRSFGIFYGKLKEINMVNIDSINKMKSLTINNEFLKLEQSAMTISIVSHYNKGKKNKLNRIDYII